MPVDLHTHTTHSDGTFEPSDLIKLASEKNLTAIAITDHDITSANNEAFYAGNQTKVKIVPGVELSVDHDLPGKGHLHILGLFIDPNHALLNQTLVNLRSARSERNRKILERLNELKLPLSEEEISLEAGKGSVGRPHIAAVMLKKGYVSNMREAFRNYLQKGSPAYIDRKRLQVNQAIDLIHLSGGLAVIAHPASLKLKSYQAMEDYILHLKRIGLDGIEAYCSGQTESGRNHLLKIARVNGLVVSGGSDFHGFNKPEIQLGTGTGNLAVPDRVYDDLLAYWNNNK